MFFGINFFITAIMVTIIILIISLMLFIQKNKKETVLTKALYIVNIVTAFLLTIFITTELEGLKKINIIGAFVLLTFATTMLISFAHGLAEFYKQTKEKQPTVVQKK